MVSGHHVGVWFVVKAMNIHGAYHNVAHHSLYFTMYVCVTL